MSRGLGEVTIIKKASSKFASLRITIPMSVVMQWKLKDGDRLDGGWKVIDGTGSDGRYLGTIEFKIQYPLRFNHFYNL